MSMPLNDEISPGKKIHLKHNIKYQVNLLSRNVKNKNAFNLRFKLLFSS